MKKFRNILLIVMTVMMTASCVEEMADPAYGEQELSFTASFDSDDDTKTILVDGKDVHWLPGDCISVSGASDAFVSDASAQCAVTTFTGSALPAETYFAVYPYESVVSWNGEVASVNVPANQTAVKGTFSDDLNISASRASSSDMNMSFHNVLGYMKFTIGEDSGSIRSVEVSAIGGESLAGAAEISYDSRTGQPSLVSTTESQTVTLSSESTLEPGDYYIAMIPGTYTEGLTLTFVATDYRVATKEIKTELTLGKGVIQNIGTVKNLTFELPFDPAEIPDDEIWYITTDGKPISLYNNDFANNGFSDSEFNVNVVSNEYSNGLGKITFESKVTEICKHSFALKNTLKSIYLPSTINKIGANAFYNSCNLECVNISSTELSIDIEFGFESPFSACSKLSKFCGPLASDDGRCIVINQTLCSFAPYGLSEYTTPQGIKTIKKGAFSRCELESITISEGVEQIEEAAFSPYDYFPSGTPLKYVYLPISLKNIHNYAFIYNQNIEAFLGNSKFISDDNYSLIIENPSCGIAMIAFASGAGLAEYTIPEGVEYIESYAFYYAESLKVLNFPDSFVDKGGAAFEGTTNIETITGKYVLDDNRSMVIDSTLVMYAGAGLEKYTTPNEVKKLGYQVLGYNNSIKEYVISDEVTDVDDLGYIFNQCPNLETVTISARMQYLGYDPFLPNSYATPNIKTIFCRAIVPPIVYHNIPEALYEFDNLTIYVPEESLDAYMSSPYWAPYRAYLKGYNYTDLPENDTYVSSDYSKDGVVTTLQTATKGEGIDIVLMGDAYSDREIADGSYEADMEYMYDNLFTQEPFKTHKDMFNVYYVNVVSATEGYDYAGAALGGYFGDGTLVGGNDNKCFEYALNAISEDEMDEALIIVAMNSDAYAGTCYMYYPESATGDYGSGPAVAYFPKGDDQTTFAQLLHHEANGHGFAKLADEYAYEDMGAVPTDYVTQTRDQQNNWGWWKNVDFTDDVEDVRWSYFLADERYDNEGLGCFEGGLTYWSGVWRPTENSIMRYNTGGFNAPSREAIYYRIHKLAYGDSWEYDYEDFVEYDAVNRTAAASAARRQRVNYVERAFEPTAAPVVTGRSWRQAR